ncbi:MAG: YfhO family protein [Bacteroidales bacterium]|nr:YfhO family protein [Bacteroidales bacterium]
MKNKLIKTFIPHVVAIIVFLIISIAYFSPMLEGKKLIQGDYVHFQGMSKEIMDFEEQGVESQWTNSMFGGMPAYLIKSANNSLVKQIHKVFTIDNYRPVAFTFIYLVGFYIALLLFGVNPWLSLIGAIVFAFSSYNFIIIAAGHNTKAFAIGYMAPIIAGIYATFKGRYLLGAAATGMFLALQIYVNHLQITYYTLLVVLVFGIIELIFTIKSKKYNSFLKATGILLIVSIIAFSSSFGKMWSTYEYGKYSIRGKSELTNDQGNKTSGLDKDYATAWSYGISETLTVLIPNFKGGASGVALSEKSASYDFFKKMQGPQYAKQVIKQMPMYWGSMPFTSGPFYFGAIVIFFFVIGIFILDPKLKWWLLITTGLSVALAWGHNFNFLTDLFLDYFPGYNKFRVVSTTLVIAQFTVPLMAILALKKIFDESVEKQKVEKAFKNSLYIVGGIALFFSILPGALFDFAAQSDQSYIAQGGQAFVDALREDRKMMLRNDAFRSLVFILLSAGIVFAFIKGKLKLNYALGLLLIFVLIDMWSVDKRYLNDNNFVSKRKAKESFQMTQADKYILQDKDPDFRVLNVSVDPFNNSSTSYFHKSIGGYHGAKMRRYQELIEHQISKNNMGVLNMLNTKYFIVPDNNRQPVAQYNPEALGNAWFVSEYRIVPNADAEMASLDDFNPGNEAIIDQRFEDFVAGKEFMKDTVSSIKLETYIPNHLTYIANCSHEELAVFSEIYYPKGWNAFIDGNPVDHFRANYVLRALVIPEGNHTIEFKFEPKSYYLGSKISYASSVILLLFLFFAFGKEIYVYFKENKE